MPLVYRMSEWSVDPNGCIVKTTTTALHLQNLKRIIDRAIPGVTCEQGRSSGLPAWNVSQRIRVEGMIAVQGATETLGELLAATQACVNVVDSCDVSQCLDFYRLPDDDASDPDSWPYTDFGALLRRAKYNGSPGAAATLEDNLVAHIRSHPLLRGADFVAAVPSSGADPYRPDLPPRWAARIANELSIKIVLIKRSKLVPSQKSQSRSQRRSNQLNSMTVDANLQGMVGLVVDDLYTTGETMAEACRVLRAQGAGAVYGLNVAKTVLGSEGYSFA